MMDATASTWRDLTAAIRTVNAAYNRLPESQRPPVGADRLDQELDAAVLSGDRRRAVAAIDRWKRHWLDTFRRAEG